MKIVFTICFSLLLLIPVTAFASGIQVSPAKLNFIATSTTQLAQELTVANPSGDIQTFQAYAEDYPNAITATPDNFSLESGGKKIVIIHIDSSELPDSLNTNLAIVGRPLTKKALSVGAGVKVALTFANKIPLIKKMPLYFIFAIILCAFAILALAAYLLTKLKRHFLKPLK